jgi:hypothetical protein
MRIQVEQHPTDHGMPMPRRLHFDGHRVDVLETLDQWCGPNYRYIKVRGYDGLYILRFDETRAEWHLTLRPPRPSSAWSPGSSCRRRRV